MSAPTHNQLTYPAVACALTAAACSSSSSATHMHASDPPPPKHRLYGSPQQPSETQPTSRHRLQYMRLVDVAILMQYRLEGVSVCQIITTTPMQPHLALTSCVTNTSQQHPAQVHAPLPNQGTARGQNGISMLSARQRRCNSDCTKH